MLLIQSKSKTIESKENFSKRAYRGGLCYPLVHTVNSSPKKEKEKKISSSWSCSPLFHTRKNVRGTLSFYSSWPAEIQPLPSSSLYLPILCPASLFQAGPAAPCDLLLPHLVLDLYPNTLILFCIRRPTFLPFFSYFSLPPIVLFGFLISWPLVRPSQVRRSLSAGYLPLQRLCPPLKSNRHPRR